ncbi:hypothetical protein PPERSA_00611 [Pseudocohnilembus persalinus]|uniref:EF-hand domain-containing protein n=1 Tax=Pseudocohnilembus persalinus TaxID=266149 RepID=A0A0V0QSL2_PSEPJ|nr:hypothetical protein PPERSA_00611 [Pseudocohnilembus persalinus]|eukprot:KRX05310.1 hypothetical protein PPERSA_00611 [Pseudocohnilembus persalinus]
MEIQDTQECMDQQNIQLNQLENDSLTQLLQKIKKLRLKYIKEGYTKDEITNMIMQKLKIEQNLQENLGIIVENQQQYSKINSNKNQYIQELSQNQCQQENDFDIFSQKIDWGKQGNLDKYQEIQNLKQASNQQILDSLAFDNFNQQNKKILKKLKQQSLDDKNKKQQENLEDLVQFYNFQLNKINGIQGEDSESDSSDFEDFQRKNLDQTCLEICQNQIQKELFNKINQFYERHFFGEMEKENNDYSGEKICQDNQKQEGTQEQNFNFECDNFDLDKLKNEMKNQQKIRKSKQAKVGKRQDQINLKENETILKKIKMGDELVKQNLQYFSENFSDFQKLRQNLKDKIENQQNQKCEENQEFKENQDQDNKIDKDIVQKKDKNIVEKKQYKKIHNKCGKKRKQVRNLEIQLRNIDNIEYLIQYQQEMLDKKNNFQEEEEQKKCIQLGKEKSQENEKNEENEQNFEFRSKAVNGKLYKDKFNEALECLESFNIKRIRNTPLGERLFSILDTQKLGYIDEQTFVSKLNELMYDKDIRVLYSFKAFNKEDNNKISRKEFQEFFSESWKAAFRLLGEKVQRIQQNQVSLSRINNWAMKQLPNLQREIDILFNNISNNNFIDYQNFKNWVTSTNIHSIEAQYDSIVQQVPVDLYQLESN